MGWCGNTAHLRQQCHNSKLVIFRENRLKVLKCYTFLWVQRRHNCSPAASFTNCVMTLYLLKVHLQTFLSVPISQKCQILNCDNGVANERHIVEPDRPPMKIRRTHIAWLKPKATNTHSECVILIAFPLQQWMQESVSMGTLYLGCRSCIIHQSGSYCS
jgi:hypothetical protein